MNYSKINKETLIEIKIHWETIRSYAYHTIQEIKEIEDRLTKINKEIKKRNLNNIEIEQNLKIHKAIHQIHQIETLKKVYSSIQKNKQTDLIEY